MPKKVEKTYNSLSFVMKGKTNVLIKNDEHWHKSLENHLTEITDFDQIAKDLCEKALKDARTILHPLLASVEPRQLEIRNEFVQAFRLALEWRLARKLISWRPFIQAVYKFDEVRKRPGTSWNGSIHLLVRVPCLSKWLQLWGQKLDEYLLHHLQILGWSCFQERQSLLEIQQVTPKEIRRGIGYGGMFFAMYSKPVRIWPKDKTRVRE